MAKDKNTPKDYKVTLTFTVTGAYEDTIGRIANESALAVLQRGLGSGVTYDYEEKAS